MKDNSRKCGYPCDGTQHKAMKFMGENASWVCDTCGRTFVDDRDMPTDTQGYYITTSDE